MRVSDLPRDKFEQFRRIVRRIDIDADYPGKNRTIEWSRDVATIKFGVCTSAGPYIVERIVYTARIGDQYNMPLLTEELTFPLIVSVGIEPMLAYTPQQMMDLEAWVMGCGV